MSLFEKIFGKPSASSASLQKIKDDADKRKASKSSASMPKVGDVEGTVASILEQRINSSEFAKAATAKHDKKNAGPKK
jgi:hypothetical protein